MVGKSEGTSKDWELVSGKYWDEEGNEKDCK
jgi:hypothetical protein